MKNSIFTVLAALVLYPAGAQPVTPQDRRRAAELVERMTLDEKIGQLVQQRGGGAVTGPDKTELSVERLVREGRCGSVFNIKSFEETERLQRIAVEESRLGIPLLIGADVIHGFRTIFPINLAVAASWDPAAAESLARVSAREASAMGIHWTFSPMCDVSRDPRWGRVSEGAGEDPYLGARVAEAMVRGYQGDLSDPSSVLACVKHFAAYGAPQAGREYHAVDMSERVFRDSYLPPYRAALDAGAATVMTSFNDLDGVPATANRWLMRDLLRDELGFGGFVVTDYGTIGELKAHGVAGDDAQAAELALRAGVNMDMMSAAYLFHAAELVREGRIPESLIDSLCREVLAVKFRLGLFDDPFRYQAKEREKCYYAPEHLDAARRVARSSMVLLENRGGVLPLKKGSRIALVGPFADSRWDLIGSWVHFAEAGRTSTFLDGLRARFGADRVTYARGCDPHKALEGGISEAVAAAAKSDVVLVALGLKAGESGEAASLASLALPDAQRDLLESLKQTGKPIVVLLVTGRPMELAREAELADALLLTWYPGTTPTARSAAVSGSPNDSSLRHGGRRRGCGAAAREQRLRPPLPFPCPAGRSGCPGKTRSEMFRTKGSGEWLGFRKFFLPLEVKTVRNDGFEDDTCRTAQADRDCRRLGAFRGDSGPRTRPGAGKTAAALRCGALYGGGIPSGIPGCGDGACGGSGAHRPRGGAFARPDGRSRVRTRSRCRFRTRVRCGGGTRRAVFRTRYDGRGRFCRGVCRGESRYGDARNGGACGVGFRAGT